MKIKLGSLLLICFLTFSLVQATDLKVMTWNIRFNNPDDGENAWPFRKQNVTNLIFSNAPDVVGLQEALLGQVNDLAAYLTGYDWVGVGRDDGINRGEYCPIFYKSQKYQLKEQGWFWLSETPDGPSMGWDAACYRICTYIKLEEYDGRKNFWVFNTHFDHLGVEAKRESARLVMSKIKELNNDKLPVVLTGDFNLTPDESAITYISRRMHDSKEKSETEARGPEGTFNSFDINSPLDHRIDYIFVNRKIAVKSYVVLTDSNDQKYPSDHLPVVTELYFK
ncbi:endonuclease/exonuclease/phosphatase family protein [Mangrovibacterium sp.]|uniref:endonuclease/exonuclease/phosphatase family protein n=1 Tax=Mangrovibacterium sp. TaxID=1961364 RepID=UPI003562CDD5